MPDGGPVSFKDPIFSEATPSPDPTRFVDQKSDTFWYKDPRLKHLLLKPVPPPRDVSRFPDRLTLTLAEALGSKGAAQTKKVQSAGQIVFHSVGDTGPTANKGPATVVMVADKMVEDFNEANPADIPQFFFHLGDVVYSFGQAEYYYDQFYDPFRDYPAPILAIPGNHDGVTYPGDPAQSLAAFIENFCSDTWRKSPQSGGLPRTTMIQPGVYWALDAPFVRIIGLYSNVLEDPGVISSEGAKNSPVTGDQLVFLKSQLDELKAANYKGAVIVAVHHPPFTGGYLHGASPRMLTDLDNTFKAASFYPHAVLSGHAHNYQRFTRSQGGRQTPYVVAGNGGHNVTPIDRSKTAPPPRTPVTVNDPNFGAVTFESYSVHFGYLRVVVTTKLLSIEFYDAESGSGSKSPSDVVTVDLQSRTLTSTRP